MESVDDVETGRATGELNVVQGDGATAAEIQRDVLAVGTGGVGDRADDDAAAEVDQVTEPNAGHGREDVRVDARVAQDQRLGAAGPERHGRRATGCGIQQDAAAAAEIQRASAGDGADDLQRAARGRVGERTGAGDEADIGIQRPGALDRARAVHGHRDRIQQPAIETDQAAVAQRDARDNDGPTGIDRQRPDRLAQRAVNCQAAGLKQAAAFDRDVGARDHAATGDDKRSVAGAADIDGAEAGQRPAAHSHGAVGLDLQRVRAVAGHRAEAVDRQQRVGAVLTDVDQTVAAQHRGSGAADRDGAAAVFGDRADLDGAEAADGQHAGRTGDPVANDQRATEQRAAILDRDCAVGSGAGLANDDHVGPSVDHADAAAAVDVERAGAGIANDEAATGQRPGAAADRPGGLAAAGGIDVGGAIPGAEQAAALDQQCAAGVGAADSERAVGLQRAAVDDDGAVAAAARADVEVDAGLVDRTAALHDQRAGAGVADDEDAAVDQRPAVDDDGAFAGRTASDGKTVAGRDGAAGANGQCARAGAADDQGGALGQEAVGNRCKPGGGPRRANPHPAGDGHGAAVHRQHAGAEIANVHAAARGRERAASDDDRANPAGGVADLDAAGHRNGAGRQLELAGPGIADVQPVGRIGDRAAVDLGKPVRAGRVADVDAAAAQRDGAAVQIERAGAGIADIHPVGAVGDQAAVDHEQPARAGGVADVDAAAGNRDETAVDLGVAIGAGRMADVEAAVGDRDLAAGVDEQRAGAGLADTHAAAHAVARDVQHGVCRAVAADDDRANAARGRAGADFRRW